MCPVKQLWMPAVDIHFLTSYTFRPANGYTLTCITGYGQIKGTHNAFINSATYKELMYCESVSTIQRTTVNVQCWYPSI